MRRFILFVLTCLLLLVAVVADAGDMQFRKSTTGPWETRPFMGAPMGDPNTLNNYSYGLFTNTTLFGMDSSNAFSQIMNGKGVTLRSTTLAVEPFAAVSGSATAAEPFTVDTAGLGIRVSTASKSVTNITTNTDTASMATKQLHALVVNVAGTTSTIALYNKNSAPCNTGYVMTLPTTTAGIYIIDHFFDTGICATTAGAAAADVSLLYR